MSTSDQRANADLDLRDLLGDLALWASAAEVLRSKLAKSNLSRESIRQLLGVSASTVQRFLAGDPTRRALRDHLDGVTRLLDKLGLTVEDLKERALDANVLLCIDRPAEGLGSIGCASVYFHVAEDHAVPVPTDPRSDQSETMCRWCGHALSANCPECRRPVAAASHCPHCGHRFIAGTLEELRGIVGRRLRQACEDRNVANRAARQHAGE